jgi:uncharacterized membrane protein (DUF106 family)
MLTGLWSLVTFIPQLLGFGTNLTNKITELKVKQVEAKTQEDKDKLQSQIDELKVKQAQQAIEAQANAHSNQLIRLLFVLPSGIYVFVCMAWDKVACKWMAEATQASSVCTTDKLDDNLWWIVMTVICFYFLTKPRGG